MDISRDELRRELRGVERDQREAMPRFTEALKRVFGDRQHSPRDRADFALGGLDRRRFLTFGGMTVLTGAVIAACGSDDDGDSGSGTGATTSTTMGNGTSTEQDITVLRTASSLEELAVETYQAAIDNASALGISSAVAEFAVLFQSHHMEHSQTFQRATTDLGGDAYTMANPVLKEMVVDPAVAALTDERSVLALAYTLEVAAAQTYQGVVPMLSSPDLWAASMAVGGVEARHVTILGGVLASAEYPQYAAGGFQTTEAFQSSVVDLEALV